MSKTHFKTKKIKNQLSSVQLFSLLDDADLGPVAADGFSLLMSDSADVLNRGCHADVRIMYRQRFFSENSAKLVEGFNAAPQGITPVPSRISSGYLPWEKSYYFSSS